MMAPSCMQNHERDSPFTGDNYDNAEADSGGTCDLFTNLNQLSSSLSCTVVTTLPSGGALDLG